MKCATSSTNYIKWGFYERTIITVFLFLPILRTIKIQRYMDKRNGKTFGILPEDVLSRRKWTISYIQFTLIVEYFSKSLRFLNGEKFGFKVCNQMTSWRVIQFYGRKAREVLRNQKLNKFSGVLCIDEKWFKCNRDWCYGIIAKDAISDIIVWTDVLYNAKKNNRWKKKAIKRFLKEVKKLVMPKVIITDMDPAYPEVVDIVFPDARHQWCLFHVKKAIYRAFKDEFGKHLIEGARKTREWLLNIFNAKTKEEAITQLKDTPKECKEFVKGRVLEIVTKFRYNTHRLFVYMDVDNLDLEIDRIPTSNTTEHTFADVRPIYLPKKSFQSIEGVTAWFNGFAVWRNHAVFVRGNRAGISPLGTEDINAWFHALDIPSLDIPLY